MSKTNLTAKQVKKLSKNPYIKLVNNHYISYTEDFLKKLVYETEENNKTSRQVFNECGIDTNIIGEHIASCKGIKDYIEYYNNYRYQLDLQKMTPVKYRNHLLSILTA